MTAHCPSIGLLSDSLLENLNTPLRHSWHSRMQHLGVLTPPVRPGKRTVHTRPHISVLFSRLFCPGKRAELLTRPYISAHLPRLPGRELLLPKSRDRKPPLPTNHRRPATKIILVSSPSLVDNYHVTLWRENRSRVQVSRDTLAGKPFRSRCKRVNPHSSPSIRSGLA